MHTKFPGGFLGNAFAILSKSNAYFTMIIYCSHSMYICF